MGYSLYEQPTTHLPQVAVARSQRWWRAAMVGFVAMLLSLVLAVGGYAIYNQDRVAPRVQVAGFDIGGRSLQEANALLDAHLSHFSHQPLALAASDQVWEISPQQLGVRYDVAATTATAMAVGRAGTIEERLRAWAPFGSDRIELQPVGTLDQARLLTGLAPVLSAVHRAPINAEVQLSPEAGLLVTPAVAGQQIDLAQLTIELQLRARQLSDQPLMLSLLPVPPATVEQDLASLKEAADALLRQPFVLELSSPGARSREWTITPEQLSAMLTVTGEEARTLALEESRLAMVVDSIATEVNRPSRNALLSITAAGQTVLEPDQPGVSVDVPATVAAINTGIAQGRYRADLMTTVESAAITSDDLQPLRLQVDRLLDRSVTLKADDVSRTLDRKVLAGLLLIEPQPQSDNKAIVAANEAAITTYLENFARQVDRAAAAPVFKYVDGAVQQVAEPVRGRQLRLDAAGSMLKAALLAPSRTEVVLPMTHIEAPAATVKPEEIILTDVLGEGRTYYGFSLPDRRHNVELATARLNGTLIAPGELFSFNRAVGRVNTATGYRTGYGIILTNGAVQTVPSVGGGICQVATTVFHAAFKSGMTIGERNWHLYWIPTYGQAPSGLTGLDATVDEDYGLDFTFRNTTGNWVAVESAFDGQYMSITLRGVNPGWEIRVDGPTITNVTPHDPTMVFRDDPTLPAGQRVQVESARDGMDVSIRRTVLKDGQVIDERAFNSHYSPSQNVILVGTGG